MSAADMRRAEMLENARVAVERDPVRLATECADREHLNRVWRAAMLSTDVATCEALLRGEDVPLDRLDPEWVARLGRRA